MSIVTTIIPTLNEEVHVERAVRSARALGPVFVVDAGSSDGTDELARAAGARVIEHTWLGYSDQKNWALENLPIVTPWVMFLDADEWVTVDLANAIRAATEAASANGYWIPRSNVFLGRRLQHAWWYPDYQLRLFRRNCGRYESRLVHEHVLLDGEAGFLAEPLMHENLKGVDELVRRHERYAELEARELLDARRRPTADQRLGKLFGTWPERRRALKRLVWYRVPARPAVRFLWMYGVKRGFLDGRAGLVYSRLLASYEAMIDAKVRELKEARRAASQPSPEISSLAVCPVCRGALEWRYDSALCTPCRFRFEIVDGIPLLVPPVARQDLKKVDQIEHFDAIEDPEFEIERPRRTPKLYAWLLREKFRRSIRSLRVNLRDEVVLTVCGGSGMDAEFLAHAGARVVSSDLSLGAARRTRERARRHRLPITAIVADAEQLPFPDRSIPVVYVHDGLHHMERPVAGVLEMARVARVALSLTEPARAKLTQLAVRVGAALEHEEAGNRVARLQLDELSRWLEDAGFSVVGASRYAMFYRHRPGPLMRSLSTPLVFGAVRTAWRLGNAALGPVGNKLTIQAVRR
jgi:glycosyltransferase involved in cell wall biosynthesis/uncharacterized protein YbaR (Trm112 family)